MWSVIGRLRPSSSMAGQTNLKFTNPYLYSSQPSSQACRWLSRHFFFLHVAWVCLFSSILFSFTWHLFFLTLVGISEDKDCLEWEGGRENFALMLLHCLSKCHLPFKHELKPPCLFINSFLPGQSLSARAIISTLLDIDEYGKRKTNSKNDTREEVLSDCRL